MPAKNSLSMDDLEKEWEKDFQSVEAWNGGRSVFTDEHRAYIVKAKERGLSFEKIAGLFRARFGFGCREHMSREYRRAKGTL